MGVWGQSPQPLGDIYVSFEKKIDFNAIWTTFNTFLKPFEVTKLLRFGSHLKKFSCSAPLAPLLYIPVKSKKPLNPRIFGLFFLVTWFSHHGCVTAPR